jgi:alpha-glucosidase
MTSSSLVVRDEHVVSHLDTLVSRSTSHVSLASSLSPADVLRVDVLGDGFARVRTSLQPTLARTWAIVDPTGAMPRAGRDRTVDALDSPLGPLPPSLPVLADADDLTLDVGRGVSVRVLQSEARLVWSTGATVVLEDLPHRAYVRGKPGVGHYCRRKPGKQHFYGFGETSGPIDKANRSIQFFPIDAMGYNAETSSPLYKHWPFYIVLDTDANFAYGLFYDTFAASLVDTGAEIDAFFGFYTKFEATCGELDLFFIAGPTVADVASRFARLIGLPQLMPRWSLGFMGSTMTYTEAENAQERLKEFVDLCRQHDIETSLFHLSSGYTTDADGRRNVFTWNRSRVPDPKAMVQHFLSAGIRLAANVKPWLLETHPRFADAETRGALIAGRAPCWAGGAFSVALGGVIDFSAAAGFDFWVEQLSQHVLEYGIVVPWNDNNEFRIADAALLNNFGAPVEARFARPLLTLLMASASREACLRMRPNERPFVLTRSACVGTQRFAQSWSGDNTTSWHTLKFNVPMGTSMSLSGLHNTGHDVGGFYGPMPDRELFLRWVASQFAMPRFTMHSFKSGAVTTPWTHPDAVDDVRNMLRFRRRLRPTLYAALWRSSLHGVPAVRPLVHDFQDDPACRTESTLYMLGDAILVVTVTEPGATAVDVRLPAACRWVEFATGVWHAGGATVRVDAPLGKCLLFVRAGGAVALADGRADDAPVRVLLAIPPHASAASQSWTSELRAPTTLIFDDGESLDYLRGAFAQIDVAATRIAADAVSVSARVVHDGFSRPHAIPVALLGAASADRLVAAQGGSALPPSACSDADDSGHVGPQQWFDCAVA